MTCAAGEEGATTTLVFVMTGKAVWCSVLADVNNTTILLLYTSAILYGEKEKLRKLLMDVDWDVLR